VQKPALVVGADRLSALPSAPMAKFRDIKVVIRSADGQYLTGGPTEWEFTYHLADAAVFDYLGDKIETHLETIQKMQGLALEALHVASHELCETCDRCKETALPTITFFDGKQFLCPDCHGHPEGAFPAKEFTSPRGAIRQPPK
jgi:hypothetical protein